MSIQLPAEFAGMLPAVSGVDDPKTKRLISSPLIRFSEIISALSVALDITQGNAPGHCMRTALIGMRLADELELSSADQSALFYALLLKDLGCSSNAARFASLFHTDDQRVKYSLRMIDWRNPVCNLKNVWSQCAPEAGPLEKLLKLAVLFRTGPAAARQVVEIRCERGAEIASMLRLPEATSLAIRDLDEHWDGGGQPRGLKGEEISLLGRICGLAQTVEAFFSTQSLAAAFDIVEQRKSKWFDPSLVKALRPLQHDAAFWQRLQGDDLIRQLADREPQEAILLADDNYLDCIAEAFSLVVDAKSPWTYKHSANVANIAAGLSEELGCTPEVVRDVRRAGLLHDIGKLGVSNLILDKPGKPTDEEFAQIRKHAEYSHRVLSQVPAFRELAEVAGGHHERLDGRGYHRGLAGAEIPFVTRILTVADICEALSASRPYRDSMPWEKIESILQKDVSRAVDEECFEALQRWQVSNPVTSRSEDQAAAVDQVRSGL
ncbi:HD-GYP domain-containing protein [Planctomicrobium piriforme]|uniref:HDIG domain-containing protein n=1 Tax=Planctomicrobium piriforme TaxID=1576369 RepID=A0A1I3D0M6_9PLAN|nr:HD-GYP domain-containing protein [Planctomicrobium piriforme]SFH80324.1 HDIG domain-containing protein [Planctomicrobium piriforme]